MGPILAFLAFFIVVPGLVALTFAFKQLRTILFFAMIYFASIKFMIHLYSNPAWRGTAWGYAITMVDILATTILLSMAFDKKAKITLFPPGATFYFFYWLAIIWSLFGAKFKLQTSFEIFKMFWMYISFVTVYNYLKNYSDIMTFLYAFVFTACIAFTYGFYQKYFGGIYQVMSTFPHQNSLAMYSEPLGLISLGVLLNEQLKRWQIGLLFMTFTFSSLLLAFTYSRGGMMFYAFGVCVVTLLSIVINLSIFRGVVFLVVCITAGSAGILYMLPNIIARFEQAPQASTEGRKHLARAAVKIANDFKFGCGANNFCEYSSVKYTYAEGQHEMEHKVLHEGDEDKVEGILGSVVETVYLLVAAECGWPGLLALLIWMYYYFFIAGWLVIAFRGQPYFGVVVGCFGGLLSNYIQSAFEWVLKQYSNFYMLVFVMAIVAWMLTERKKVFLLKKRYGMILATFKPKKSLSVFEK